MLSAGSCCSICARLSLVRPLDLPFIHTSTLELPRRDTLPSLSTSTDGMLSSTSLAACPELLMSCDTSNDLRSTSSFMDERCPVTVTSLSCCALSEMYITANDACGLSALTLKSRVTSLYPTNDSVSV